MKSLDLNLLTALDALLSTTSVSEAAVRMHLSTPAMSHTLARIRDALGDPILVRAGRKLIPTARALELREPVRRWVAEARALMQPGQARDLSGVEREFVVRAPEGTGIIFGAALLAALQKTLPLATLRFIPESNSDAMALREGRIDLDIGTVHDRGPEIQSSLLYTQRLVGAVKTGHPLTTGRVTVKRFSEQRHVALSQREQGRGNGSGREPLDALLMEAGCARRVALTVPSAYGALMAAACSDLVACVPEHLARRVAAGLDLQLIKLPVNLPVEHVVQAWHPRVDGDAAHQALRACVSGLTQTGPKRTRPGYSDDALGSKPSPHEIHRSSARHRDLLNMGRAVKAHSTA
jgi:DNA-binding transcriptional LysR family regulator